MKRRSLLPLLAVGLLACEESSLQDEVSTDTGAAGHDHDQEHDDHDDDPDVTEPGDPGDGGGDGGGDGDTGGALADEGATRIDATAEAWVSYDLDTDRLAEDGWDLRFQRYSIAVNGGVSGDGGVEVAIISAATVDGVTLDSVTLDDVQAVPAAGWQVDEPDADGDGTPEYAFADWYDYDPATHVLTPREQVYAVRTTEGLVFAVEILSYYDDAGTSGHPSFAWKLLGEVAQ